MNKILNKITGKKFKDPFDFSKYTVEETKEMVEKVNYVLKGIHMLKEMSVLEELDAQKAAAEVLKDNPKAESIKLVEEEA